VKTSRRAQGVQPSPTLAVDREAKALAAEGVDIVNFGIGEPDFDTPPAIKAAAIAAVEAGATKYTAADGTPALKAAIQRYFRRFSGLEYGLDQVMASVGAKQAILNALLALVDPGDEVLLPAPYWVSYPEQIRLADGVPVIVPTMPDGGYHVTAEALAAASTPRTRGLILNSPANPTGAVLSAEELKAIAAFAAERNIWVLSDEIYHRLVFDGDAPSIAALPGMQERTVVINGVSKAYAMTGWRIGFAAGPAPVIAAMARIQGQSTSNPATMAQAAAVAALDGDQEATVEMVQAYRLRRNLMLDGLAAIPGLRPVPPAGAFYVFCDLTGLAGRRLDGLALDDGDDLATVLLRRAGVAVVPGSGFGAPRAVRLSFAQSEERIQTGLERMRRVLAEA
jgi:aspartate aminotransferase